MPARIRIKQESFSNICCPPSGNNNLFVSDVTGDLYNRNADCSLGQTGLPVGDWVLWSGGTFYNDLGTCTPYVFFSGNTYFACQSIFSADTSFNNTFFNGMSVFSNGVQFSGSGCPSFNCINVNGTAVFNNGTYFSGNTSIGSVCIPTSLTGDSCGSVTGYTNSSFTVLSPSFFSGITTFSNSSFFSGATTFSNSTFFSGMTTFGGGIDFCDSPMSGNSIVITSGNCQTAEVTGHTAAQLHIKNGSLWFDYGNKTFYDGLDYGDLSSGLMPAMYFSASADTSHSSSTPMMVGGWRMRLSGGTADANLVVERWNGVTWENKHNFNREQA